MRNEAMPQGIVMISTQQMIPASMYASQSQKPLKTNQMMLSRVRTCYTLPSETVIFLVWLKKINSHLHTGYRTGTYSIARSSHGKGQIRQRSGFAPKEEMIMTAKRSRRSFGYVRKLPSGMWQASYLGPDGKRHNAPTTFQTKIDADGYLSTVQAKIIE